VSAILSDKTDRAGLAAEPDDNPHRPLHVLNDIGAAALA
jgi:hypothetical protein